MSRKWMINIIKDNMKMLCLSKGVPYSEELVDKILKDPKYTDEGLDYICTQIAVRGYEVLEMIWNEVIKWYSKYVALYWELKEL